MSCVDGLPQQLRTCDSFFTTQMIQLESTVLTENNTFDVYALSLYRGQISALLIVCFGNYTLKDIRSENGLSQNRL